MYRGSSVVVTELERELPSTVLIEYAKRIARSSRADPGGLRVLKHPPKLPKVNYLLLLLINCRLTP